MTNTDNLNNRYTLIMALADPGISKLADSKIAELLEISTMTVTRARKSLAGAKINA